MFAVGSESLGSSGRMESEESDATWFLWFQESVDESVLNIYSDFTGPALAGLNVDNIHIKLIDIKPVKSI